MADTVPHTDRSDPITVLSHGGEWHVRLSTPGHPPVILGPYQNPDVARQTAERLRGFLAAFRAADTVASDAPVPS
jgi:hypothetical protein